MPLTLNTPDLWADALPQESAAQNKYTRGHVLVICGPQMTGASRLAAAAARHIGAGLVTFAGQPAQEHLLLADAPGALFYPLNPQESLESFCAQHQVRALVVGQGLGKTKKSQLTVTQALGCNLPIVLDADAITAFEHSPKALYSALHKNCVLTPHAGEFQAFFTSIQGHGKAAATQLAAHKTKGVVVYKGAETIIATPEACIQNTPASPLLATAGSGDVLAGVIGGLMAKGMPPHLAACAGVWAHTKAADALKFGFIAEDLPRQCAQSLHPYITIEN